MTLKYVSILLTLSFLKKCGVHKQQNDPCPYTKDKIINLIPESSFISTSSSSLSSIKNRKIQRKIYMKARKT